MPDIALLENQTIEITDKPITHEVGENKAIREVASKSIDYFQIVQAGSLQKLQEILKRETDILRQRFGIDYSAERIDLVTNWMFNIFMLDWNTLTARNERISDHEKDISARIQQGLVHNIFYSSTPYASEGYVNTMYHIVRAILAQISKMERVETTNLPMVWGGIRNELAVVRTLTDHGYRVFLPNYSQNSGRTPEGNNAILQLDVRNGIDLITISPQGHIILMDVKGRKPVEGIPHSNVYFKRVLVDQYPNPLVKQAVKDVADLGNVENLLDVYKTILYFPTEGRSFVANQLMGMETKDYQAQQTELKKFGLLQDRVQKGIISQLQFAPFMLR